MKKRVFIVHGWGGSPQEGWFPWLKNELENKGFVVEIPSMPDTENPKLDTWIPFLNKIAGNVDENTFFVGHSIGCQTIFRYLENLSADKKIGGVVLVAGWFTLMNLDENEKEIAKPWLEVPIDFEKVKAHVNKFIAIFSDNDDVVPFDNRELFEKRLNAKTIIEHKKGHFSGGDGITELPIALKSILEISN